MRQRVGAIIIEEDKILLMHRVKNDNEYWVFPGGGVDDEDVSLEDGLKRECKEELGVDVEVKDLFMNKLSPDFDQVDFFYICKIIEGKVGTGTGPEFTGRDIEKYGTYEVIWLELSDLKNRNVYPLELRDKIISNFKIS